MAKTWFYIEEDDAKIVNEVISDYRRRNRATASPLEAEREAEMDDMFTPEVYVAKIPEAGIPALTEDGGSPVPGTATCDIYKVISSMVGTTLVGAEFDKPVYNVSAQSIETTSENGDYKIVWRDKYGHWVTEGCPCAFL